MLCIYPASGHVLLTRLTGRQRKQFFQIATRVCWQCMSFLGALKVVLGSDLGVCPALEASGNFQNNEICNVDVHNIAGFKFVC